MADHWVLMKAGKWAELKAVSTVASLVVALVDEMVALLVHVTVEPTVEWMDFVWVVLKVVATADDSAGMMVFGWVAAKACKRAVLKELRWVAHLVAW